MTLLVYSLNFLVQEYIDTPGLNTRGGVDNETFSSTLLIQQCYSSVFPLAQIREAIRARATGFSPGLACAFNAEWGSFTSLSQLL